MSLLPLPCVYVCIHAYMFVHMYVCAHAWGPGYLIVWGGCMCTCVYMWSLGQHGFSNCLPIVKIYFQLSVHVCACIQVHALLTARTIGYPRNWSYRQLWSAQTWVLCKKSICWSPRNNLSGPTHMSFEIRFLVESKALV